MANVLLVAYLLIVLALIAVILLQRSEGGGLGMGGGGNANFMSVRGSANLLTRTTAVLATLFMATAIGLTILSEIDRGSQGILERASDGIGTGGGGGGTVLDALNQLQAQQTGEPVAPSAADPGLAVPQAPAAPPAPAAPAAPASATPPASTTPAAPAEPAPAAPAADPGLAVPAAPAPAGN